MKVLDKCIKLLKKNQIRYIFLYTLLPGFNVLKSILIISKINNISRSHIKSESDNKWNLQLNESNDKFNYNEKINEEDYEFEADDIPDEDVVKNLD